MKAPPVTRLSVGLAGQTKTGMRVAEQAWLDASSQFASVKEERRCHHRRMLADYSPDCARTQLALRGTVRTGLCNRPPTTMTVSILIT